MDLTVTINLDASDKTRLADALGCTEADLPARLKGHAQAALHEYVELYLGRRVFSRGSDILEHRLALLVQHAFGNLVPDEGSVARLFQSTLSQARSLTRSALSKYRFQLETAARASAKDLLEHARWSRDSSVYRVTINTANLVDLLNQALAREDGNQKPLSRNPESQTTYEIAEGSYGPLCRAFGARPVAKT
jgi:hypothetical protein